ncbi:hypothetical protein AB0B51_37495, partial [Streptomyces griseus]|uniref:hypothetical protein n=1 Tax=Streptomyces griseus TaxID=1911 RepID=UPI0034079F88
MTLHLGYGTNGLTDLRLDDALGLLADLGYEGVTWLTEAQQADGSWDEPYFTGTGFPWDFSI